MMRTVIIADDDRNVCECITRLIDWASIGYAPPILCHDGAEALEQFARRDPDLVITDLKMPVMDGDTLCREIRKRSAETEIVFLSAYEDFSVAQTALQYNVRDYILKPITRDALQKLTDIAHAIALQRAHTQRANELTSPETIARLRNAIDARSLDGLADAFETMMECADELPVQVTNLCLFMMQLRATMMSSKEFTGYCTEQSRIMEIPTVRRRVEYVQREFEDLFRADPALPDVVRRAKRLIDAHYAEPDFNISQLAITMDVTSGYLGRIFSEHMNKNLVDYIAAKRIDRACEMLRTTRVPIADIAEQCGYANGNYFTKAFRNKMKISPSDYRCRYNREP